MNVSAARRIAGLAIIVVGLLVCAGVVGAAQGGPIPETEDDQMQQEQALPVRPDIVGDDPDENGYAGPAPQAAGAQGEPSEVGASALPGDRFSPSGPDQQNWPDAIDAGPDWTTFYYFFAAGSTFRPRDSVTGWDYVSNGCISARGGSDLFTLHLEVPHGARIDYLRIFYYDTNAAATRGYITTYDAQGGTIDLVGVSSTGTAGYGTALSAYLGHIVDTENDAYVLNWVPGAQGTTVRLCGLRVAYRLPS
jgi:catechol 2,3-dioxygenase-like lactoylglutathione lyase family enzyme